MTRDRTRSGNLEFFEQLTNEDRSVIGELILGLSYKQVAARLDLSLDGVHQSDDRILRKLGCQNRTEVAVLAYGRLRPFVELTDKAWLVIQPLRPSEQCGVPRWMAGGC